MLESAFRHVIGGWGRNRVDNTMSESAFSCHGDLFSLLYNWSLLLTLHSAHLLLLSYCTLLETFCPAFVLLARFLFSWYCESPMHLCLFIHNPLLSLSWRYFVMLLIGLQLSIGCFLFLSSNTHWYSANFPILKNKIWPRPFILWTME